MQTPKINFNIADGEEFFAHEVTVNFNPTQFVLDFKCVTPRSDPRNKDGPNITLRHNVVMLDAYHALKLHELIGNVITRYEKEFGKIKKPKAIEIAEKKKVTREKTLDKSTAPSYFG